MGIMHFHRGLAFPEGWTTAPVAGNGISMALLTALHDYWGYYNICFFGEEVANPGRTIPRSMLISITVVAVLYMAMNISILGILPGTRPRLHGARDRAKLRILASGTSFLRQLGVLMAILIIWTASASVFTLLEGYSCIPFAAARDGDFFSIFSKVHPEKHFPANSVLLLGGMATLFCTFRMWLYPLPVLITIDGFSMVLFDKKGLVLRGLSFALIGIAVYLGRLFLRSNST
jgi:amino acid transporter